MKRLYRFILAGTAIMFVLCAGTGKAKAQGKEIVLNLAPLDGVALTPENVFSYGIQSGLATTTANIKGTVRYKQSGLSFSYTFTMTLRPGMNMPDVNTIRPVWSWSGNALRELFQDYHTLPEGTYEYCVSIAPVNQAGEPGAGGEITECLYGKKDDIFLINLVDPENNAKLYEYYPNFSWIVNYPFASQLTYRIRVAEIKEGQNTENAIVRNNPVYQESNLPQTTTSYPVYGTPLKTFQPYAWTVDAYYKGILLGGAEPWKFTIIEDSEMNAIPRNPPYLDIRREHGSATNYAIGELKIKYELEDLRKDSLTLTLTDKNGTPIKFKQSGLSANYGDNRFIIDLRETASLKHKQTYILNIRSTKGSVYKILFKYVNPDFLK